MTEKTTKKTSHSSVKNVKKKSSAATKSKPTWAETMKKALDRKQPAGGFPDQPKPRDSGTLKVKKNSI